MCKKWARRPCVRVGPRPAVVALLFAFTATPPELLLQFGVHPCTRSARSELVLAVVRSRCSTLFGPRKFVCRVRRAQPPFCVRVAHIHSLARSDLRRDVARPRRLPRRAAASTTGVKHRPTRRSIHTPRPRAQSLVLARHVYLHMQRASSGRPRRGPPSVLDCVRTRAQPRSHGTPALPRSFPGSPRRYSLNGAFSSPGWLATALLAPKTIAKRRFPAAGCAARLVRTATRFTCKFYITHPLISRSHAARARCASAQISEDAGPL